MREMDRDTPTRCMLRTKLTVLSIGERQNVKRFLFYWQDEAGHKILYSFSSAVSLPGTVLFLRGPLTGKKTRHDLIMAGLVWSLR